jgi:hypothetical protein
MMWLNDYMGPGTGVATYSKAVIAFNALGAIVGDSAVGRAFAEYARAWKYKHPTPYDFFFSMNKSLGKNLDWFWHEWFFTTYTFDQAIQSVSTSGDTAVVAIRDKGDLAMPVVLKVETTDGGVSILTYPVEIWFPGQRTVMMKMPLHGKDLKSLTLDPENRFQDLDRSDNVKTF